MTNDVLRSYLWFRKHGVGGIVGRDAATCLALARAECAAMECEWYWIWEDDYYGWVDIQNDLRIGYISKDCRPDRCQRCVLYNEKGEEMASLCGIWDADDNYRRIVQAELACECSLHFTSCHSTQGELNMKDGHDEESGRAVLKAWAQEHGSELLQCRIEDGYDWESLAEEEYGDRSIMDMGFELTEANFVPDGFKSPIIVDIKAPTISEIKSLRKVLRYAPSNVTAKLIWCVYHAEKDDNGYDTADSIRRVEIVVTVTCPNGSDRRYFFFPN